MRKEEIIDQVKEVLKKHKISISGLQVKVDTRPSRNNDYKSKVDLLISNHDSYMLQNSKTKIVDILKDLKAVDDKLIIKTQLCKSGKSHVLRLYLAKKLSTIEKFTQRRVILKATNALQTKNNILLNVQIGMTINILHTPENMSTSQILKISKNFIKVQVENKVKNLPVNFFSNKTVLIIKSN